MGDMKTKAILKAKENIDGAIEKTKEIYGDNPIGYWACVAIAAAGLEWIKTLRATPTDTFEKDDDCFITLGVESNLGNNGNEPFLTSSEKADA
jgi:hypothetical protein